MDEDSILKQKDIFSKEEILSYINIADEALIRKLGVNFVKKYVGAYYEPLAIFNEEEIWFTFYILSRPFGTNQKRDLEKDSEYIIFSEALSIDLKSKEVEFYDNIDLVKNNFKEINMKSKEEAKEKILTFINSKCLKDEIIINNRINILNDIKRGQYHIGFMPIGRLFWEFNFEKFGPECISSDHFCGCCTHIPIYNFRLLVDVENGKIN